jgi:arylsulfatase A-like enzyme
MIGSNTERPTGAKRVEEGRREQPAALTRWLSGTAILLLAAAIATGCGPPEPRRVILIGVDTLRADHLGTYGYERPTSPFLDTLAEQGVVFERTFATSSWTLPSFASIFTGRSMSGHAAGIDTTTSDEEWAENQVGTYGRAKLDPGVETIAEVISAAGIPTIAVAQNPYMDPIFGLDRGFDEYDYARGENAEKRRADVVVDHALEWIDRQEGGDFFLFVHFFDPHMNYGAPEPWGGLFTSGVEGDFSLPVTGHRALRNNAATLPPYRREFIAAAYDEEIRFVDAEIERFVSALKERGIWEGSLVIFTGDHGEELFEHGGFEHGHTMYNEVVGVPLMIWGPGIMPRRTRAPATIADIAPTILEALGLEVFDGTLGRSLWPLLTRGEELPERLLVAEGALWGPDLRAGIAWPRKVILDVDSGEVRLFDLRNDPREMVDLGDDPALVADLLERLEMQLLAASHDVRHQAVELDPEMVRRLRSLGYIQ